MSRRLPVVDSPPGDLDRRQLMQLLAAGAGLAGLGPLAGCMEPPKERIQPRVEQPPELTPGVPLEYATSIVIDGFATGVVVKTYEARPTKVEGNPEHPASLGASGVFHQASVLELYDPHRLAGATDRGTPIDLAATLRTFARKEPIRGLWFVMPPQSSPLVADLIARVRARHPGARFATYAPLERRSVYQGAALAFGRPVEAQYRFGDADIVVSLDGDFLGMMPGSLRWAHDFAGHRRLTAPGAPMSRLYVAEPRPSPTGSLADHRVAVAPSRIAVLARELLAAVRGTPSSLPDLRERRWVNAAAADLVALRGRGLVLAGDRQPAEVHAVVHAIDTVIGAIGSTVAFTEPAIIDPLGDGIGELAAAIQAKAVGMLVIADLNPLYTAPGIEPLLDAVETVCATQHASETSARVRWCLPLAHAMESWGDARAYDGTLSLIQPLIRPLRPCVSLIELLAAFAGDEQPDGHRLLRDRYAKTELEWQRDLRRGFLADTAFAPVTVTAREGTEPAPPSNGFELSFDASPAVYDGRFAHTSWLQELPKPHDKITWGNAAVISPRTARQLGVEHADLVRIACGKARAELPVYVLPGHADGCASLELGYGRRGAGPIADGVGVDIYPLRADGRAYATGTITATGKQGSLAVTQQHFDQDGRDIAPMATLAAYRAHPDFTAPHRGEQPNLLPDLITGTPQWAMTIDTMVCTGCSSCVIACQAENNVPVVGREEVTRNRAMHWLRIDTYRDGDGDHVVHQPMLCQHCEKAPCEYVCPVYATQHSPDGLNEMVYNRCIGTRFCSNNCPYKVRRFNWFDYTEDTPKTERLQFNPSVTVRARGVMEKCTYCVQRIRAAEITAREERREIRPNEVVTACQQACPMGAIRFGSLHHTQSDVMTWRKEPRRYGVLHHLGTEPRTIYLAKISNPRSEG